MSALTLSDGGVRSRVQPALRDLVDGARAYHIWGLLGWQDIRQRYRRSVLGPFWITISAAAMIGGIGLLYSKLMHQDTREYIPYLSVGLLVWMFISTLINEACTTFVAAEQMIKQVKLPLTIHVWRMVWRNLIILAHNLVILIPVFWYYHRGVDARALLAIAGLLLVALNGYLLGISLGLLSARYRDVPQIIGNLVQVAFFMTPIMFATRALGTRGWIAQANPFYHFLEIVRAPLLGQQGSAESWLYALCTTLVSVVITLLLFNRYRSRIAYWV